MKLAFVAAAMAALGILALYTYRGRIAQTRLAGNEERHVPPVLIPGVAEPAELRIEPIAVIVPTPPERMLGDAMKQVGTQGGPSALAPALDRILSQYPDYSDGYVLRLSSLCEQGEREALLLDINNALKYIGTSRVGKDSLNSLLSMRAKIEHANGDDATALEDLDKSIHANLGDAEELADSSGATAPEQSASACTWTLPDMDALVHSFPHDYRAYMFRGLYYSSFVLWNEPSIKLARGDFQKAGELNPKSALPPFFSAATLKRGYSFKRLGLSEAQRDDLNRTLLNELNAALTLDPTLLPALADRAEAYLELRHFIQAIPDYTKILSLNPSDYGAYNDRALAKMQLGNTYEAISDFSDAIKYKKRVLQESSSYENRADAYIKTQQWDLAVQDLTTAISLQICAVAILGNIHQFRSLYPEYKSASDEAVARKLNQTFFPNMTYEDFSKGFLHTNPDFDSTIVPDMYMKRSDAYLKAGYWHEAAVEYRRAVGGFSSYADSIERWRGIGEQQTEPVTFIDLKTFDDTRRDSAKLWIKVVPRSSSDSATPYSVEQDEMNCDARQIRTVSYVNYDGAGNALSSRESEKWTSVIPETLGETLFNGMCRNH